MQRPHSTVRHVGMPPFAGAAPLAARPLGRLFDKPVGNADCAMCVARHFGIVRNQDDRDSLGVQPLEHPQDLVAGAGIEVARRLVGQQERRPVDQRSGDGRSLLLPAGHL